MQLSPWPLYRVLLACLAWALITGVALVGVSLARARALAREQGIASISFGVTQFLAPVLAPPLVFLILWLFMRRS